MTLDELETVLRLGTEISIFWEDHADAIGKEGLVRVRGPTGDQDIAKILMMAVGPPWSYRFIGKGLLEGWDQDFHRTSTAPQLTPRWAGRMLIHGVLWKRAVAAGDDRGIPSPVFEEVDNP